MIENTLSIEFIKQAPSSQLLALYETYIKLSCSSYINSDEFIDLNETIYNIQNELMNRLYNNKNLTN